jgi:outer membrane protein
MQRSARPHRFKRLSIGIALGLGGLSAQAQSLVELYSAAKEYDASYQSAKSQYDATVARGEQARAAVLPTVNLSASGNQTRNDNSLSNPSQREFSAQSATLSASQPLFRPANWASAAQGKMQLELAQAQRNSAELDLIVRVSQAYFDVLAATDSLDYITSQKAAVAEQLASAKRNFEVGTATITDTRDAQARFDLVGAQQLAAENDLRVKSLALEQLVGKPGARPKPLRMPVALPPLAPADVSEWVAQAEKNNPSLLQLQTALEVAKLETDKAQSGHQPTVDLVGSYTTSSNSGSASSAASFTNNSATIGLSFNLPLFAGFSVQNRIKEVMALENKARNDLDAAKRSVAQATRSAFFGVQSGLSQVRALEAAEVSSQSALDANKLGYQVGVKINIDVLNSQSQLFDTKAKLAKARYDVLVGGLRLRQATGSLSEQDLASINRQLSD